MNSYWLSRSGSDAAEGPYSFGRLEEMFSRGELDAQARVCLVQTEDWRPWLEESNALQQEWRERERMEAAKVYHAGGGLAKAAQERKQTWLFWWVVGGSVVVFLFVFFRLSLRDDGMPTAQLAEVFAVFEKEMEAMGLEAQGDAFKRRMTLFLPARSVRSFTDYELKTAAQMFHRLFKGHASLIIQDEFGNELSRADDWGASVSR